MSEHEATRTLVKSPPELWAQCSDHEALTRHLSGSFGEIRITRLEPESAVAWEGEHARGTVRLEPSGWGTKVTLTADRIASEPEPAQTESTDGESGSATSHRPHGPAVSTPSRPARVGLLTRMRTIFWKRIDARYGPGFLGEPGAAYVQLTPEPPARAPELAPQDVLATLSRASTIVATDNRKRPGEAAQRVDDVDLDAVLSAALDSLGSAHHRPFSRQD